MIPPDSRKRPSEKGCRGAWWRVGMSASASERFSSAHGRDPIASSAFSICALRDEDADLFDQIEVHWSATLDPRGRVVTRSSAGADIVHLTRAVPPLSGAVRGCARRAQPSDARS